MRARFRGRVAFVVVGVRSKDVPGVAEDAAVRAWIQTVRADLEQASFGAVVLDLEWHGWLESPHDRETLGCLDTAALAVHARSLIADPRADAVVAVINCPLRHTGTVGRDVVAEWITLGGQGGLRRCRHCGALHLAQDAALSHCWGGTGGHHEFDDEGAYELARGAEADVHHQNCSSCHAIWTFDGNSRGHCPKNPTGHTGGDRYLVARADGGQWAECTACQRVIAIALAEQGCVDSRPDAPVPHTLATDRPLAVACESFPTLGWGVRAVAESLGIHEDLDATGRGGEPTPHPRFWARGPLPSVAAAWTAGWLPAHRVSTVAWRPRARVEVVLAPADSTGSAPVLVQIVAPGAIYAVELRDDALQLRRFLGRGTNGVDGWRACTACGAAVDTAALGCAAGGLHEHDAADLAVPFDKGYVRATSGWRRCARCNALWHDASGEGSACAAGGPHRGDPATAYALRPSETTTGYRACKKCRSLVDPLRVGVACTNGGAHEIRRSPFFTLDVVRRGASAHSGWAACRKCGVVVFTASQHCAKTVGAHVLEDRDHAAEHWVITAGTTAAWRCIRCACMFGHAGVCALGGRHRGAGMFPDVALRDAAVVDRTAVPQPGEPPFPGGAAAMLALRRTWQICRDCGVVFAVGSGAACPATGKKHGGGGPRLVMSSDALESWRVLVAMGDDLAADRDGFGVRVVSRGDAGVTVAIEPVA